MVCHGPRVTWDVVYYAISVPTPHPSCGCRYTVGFYADVRNADMTLSHPFRPYFIDHVTKTTTFEDPRIKLAADEAAARNGADGPGTPNTHAARTNRNRRTPAQEASAMVDLGPLPEGWEQRHSDSGRAFFVNHETKKYEPYLPLQKHVNTTIIK